MTMPTMPVTGLTMVMSMVMIFGEMDRLGKKILKEEKLNF